MPTSWRRYGAVDARAIEEARLVLHHAAQLAAAPGRSLLEARPDDSHTALGWSAELQALVGETVPGPTPWRAALRPGDLTLLVLTPDLENASAFLLAGRSLDEAFGWLGEQASERGTAASRLSRERPYEIPRHPVSDGEALPSPPSAEHAELARHFANSDRLLRWLVADDPGASPVLCWPHHFDIGASIRLDPAGGDASPTIGIGMSPGDEGVPEPYYYVNAWPRPERLPDPLPPLPDGGRWNTEGWLGASLPTRELVALNDAEGQEAGARGFLVHAVEAARGLLGGR
jgi:hypothetical protein